MNIERPKKPISGSWTADYPHLGTHDVDYTDSVSEEFYRKEMDAIFRQCWLNLGRVEQLPKAGSYFTKEFPFANTSIIVVRGRDGQIRAFHNICSHRGNKLVWDEHPGREVSGDCPRFRCKYHAWTYGLDGALLAGTRKEEFFNFDRAKYGLSPVACDVWEGFIHVNLDPSPKVSLKEFLGEMGEGLAGYPFHLMTQTYAFRAVVKSNWKIFADSFAEAYHTPYMHGKMSPEMAEDAVIADGLTFKLIGPHSTASFRHVPTETEQATPIEKLTQCGLYGPWDKPDLDIKALPKGFNPANAPDWGIDSHQIFPNTTFVIWERGWYQTWQFWPMTVDTHLFESRQYFVPPKNAQERLAQEMAIITTREYAMQDANTLEATHSMLKSGVKTHFPISDQEIVLRHLHYHVNAWVKAGGPPVAAR
jgi:phenylpropionate dioxygenase-like ring-hydroxylating dioxygenase large terminal subunit